MVAGMSGGLTTAQLSSQVARLQSLLKGSTLGSLVWCILTFCFTLIFRIQFQRLSLILSPFATITITSCCQYISVIWIFSPQLQFHLYNSILGVSILL